jgi:hypothetical protein
VTETTAWGGRREKEDTVNWNKVIRHIVAVVLASAIPIGLAVVFAGWSDALGLGLFLIAVGVGIVTMVHCHLSERLYSNQPMSRSIMTRFVNEVR